MATRSYIGVQMPNGSIEQSTVTLMATLEELVTPSTPTTTPCRQQPPFWSWEIYPTWRKNWLRNQAKFTSLAMQLKVSQSPT